MQNAGDAATEALRTAILDGRLSPGQRLKEAEVAEAFQVSRTPVREALRSLHREGLLVASPNRGVSVRRYSPIELSEIYELRALLEGLAARRAAARVRAEDLARMRESCVRFSALGGEAAVIELVRENARFHELVLAAAGSVRLSSLARGVTEMPLVYRTYSWYSQAQRVRAEREHQQLTDALQAGDADHADALMRGHVMAGWEVLVSHLEAGPPAGRRGANA